MALTQLLLSALSYENIFERVIDGLERETTTDKGHIWEEFCQRYLQAKGYETVWLLKDVPVAIKEKLNLGGRDMGIDLIISHQGFYSAVQCKYRKRHVQSRCRITISGKTTKGINGLGIPKEVTIYRNKVGWKELSTFFALCATTGPWARRIVMTTADGVAFQGKKTPIDRTYAYRGFETEDRSVWLKMAGSSGNRLGEAVVSPSRLTADELRARRLSFYSQTTAS